MGRLKKKGESGAATNFITRNQAIKRLQITLPEFRKLCILKGIFPRDPRKKTKGKDKTYYFLKDIKYMAHDPLVEKFREYRQWRAKVARAKGRNEKDKVEYLKKHRPEYSLIHLVKERYPTFTDALRDLDDAVTMINLFAIMPIQVAKAKPERIERCLRLAREFQYYVVKTNSLRKVFVSIKGYYYQADIFGNLVTWIVPHKFNQRLVNNVDYKVMLTFLEFYEVLVGFVNFKLFHALGMKYPPQLDVQKDELGETFRSIIAESITPSTAATNNKSGNAKASEQLKKKSEQRLASLNEALTKIAAKADAPEPSVNVNEDTDVFDDETEKLKLEAEVYGKLFDGCVVFLSREVPREHLEFVIRSFGGQVSYDNGPVPEDSPQITHQIVDRGTEPTNRIVTREYVQPQYIFDCVNARVLLPVELYGATAQLPPHLSPFVDDEAKGYVPEFRKKLDSYIQQARGEAFDDAPDEEGDVVEEGDDDSDDDDEDDEVDEVDAEDQPVAEELSDEMDTQPKSKPSRANARKAAAKQEIDEQMELAVGMLSSKKRKAIEYLKKRQRGRDDEIARLSDKRRKVEQKKMVVQDGLLKPAKLSK